MHLIHSVLRMWHFLVLYRLYTARELEELLGCLVQILSDEVRTSNMHPRMHTSEQHFFATYAQRTHDGKYRCFPKKGSYGFWLSRAGCHLCCFSRPAALPLRALQLSYDECRTPRKAMSRSKSILEIKMEKVWGGKGWVGGGWQAAGENRTVAAL